jgi:hypothetical protein
LGAGELVDGDELPVPGLALDCAAGWLAGGEVFALAELSSSLPQAARITAAATKSRCERRRFVMGAPIARSRASLVAARGPSCRPRTGWTRLKTAGQPRSYARVPPPQPAGERSEDTHTLEASRPGCRLNPCTSGSPARQPRARGLK